MTERPSPAPGSRQVSYLHTYTPRYQSGLVPHRTTAIYLVANGFDGEGWSTWREVARHEYPTYGAAMMATELFFAGTINFGEEVRA